MQKKRILCVHSQIVGLGGIPRFNQNLLKAVEENYSVKTLSLNDGNEYGIKGFKRNKISFFISFLFNLIKRPDLVVIGHIHFASFSIFTRIFRLQSVMILHGIEAWNPKGLHSQFLKYIDHFWPVSTYTKKRFLEHSARHQTKIKQIFNTLDPQWDLSHESKNQAKFFLTVTRLDKQDDYKGVDKTIHAIHGIKEILLQNDWTYRIVASGTDVVRHKKLVSELKLESIIEFYENLDDRELMKLYNECGFFILVSTGEGFGIVYLEAMASRKACIGAINSGAEEVISDERTGYLIDQNEQEIKEKILQLIKDNNLARSLGERGFKRLIDRFSFVKFKERIDENIEACVE